MPEQSVPSPFQMSMLAGWLRQGTQGLFASQRILMELVARQNAHTWGAIQERMKEARDTAVSAASEVAGEGISNFIAAERVLFHLAQRQNEIVTTAVKEQIGGPAPVAALTELVSRGIDTAINMQQHFLSLAARQADEWLDATKAGEPYQGMRLGEWARDSMENFVRSQKKFLDALAEETAHATGENDAKTSATKKTELAELARQSAEAYVDAQKKLLDVAAQQLMVSAKTAREIIDAINPLSGDMFNDWTRQTVAALAEYQQSLVNLVVKPAKNANGQEHKKPSQKHNARRTNSEAEAVEA